MANMESHGNQLHHGYSWQDLWCLYLVAACTTRSCDSSVLSAGYRADEGFDEYDDDYPVAVISSQQQYSSFTSDVPHDVNYADGQGQRRISYGDDGFDRMKNGHRSTECTKDDWHK